MWVRDKMWGVFRDLYWWRLELTERVRMEWEAMTKKRVKDILYKARQKVEKGSVLPWVDEGSLGALDIKWKSQAFQDRSKQVKEKKSKSEAKNTQGSVSTVHVTKKPGETLKTMPDEAKVLCRYRVRRWSSVITGLRHSR